MILSLLDVSATVTLPPIQQAIALKRYLGKRLGAGTLTFQASGAELIDDSSSVELDTVGGNLEFVALNFPQVPEARRWIVIAEQDVAPTTPHTPAWLVLSSTVHTSGTTTATVGEIQRYDPNSGGVQVNAPASPSTGERFAVKNVTTDMTSTTISGNGNNIEEVTKNSAFQASFTTTIRRFFGHWIFDGTQWLLSSE